MNEDFGYIGMVALRRRQLLQNMTDAGISFVNCSDGASWDTEPYFFTGDVHLRGHALRITGAIRATPFGCAISGSVFLAEWIGEFDTSNGAIDEMVRLLATAVLSDSGLYLVLGLEDAFECSLAPGLVGCYSPEFWSLVCQQWPGHGRLDGKLILRDGRIFIWPQSSSDYWLGKSSTETEQLVLDALGSATESSLRMWKVLDR